MAHLSLAQCRVLLQRSALQQALALEAEHSTMLQQRQQEQPAVHCLQGELAVALRCRQLCPLIALWPACWQTRTSKSHCVCL